LREARLHESGARRFQENEQLFLQHARSMARFAPTFEPRS
jgi:hypothetical protein